jgi:hypothetical protein
MDWGTVTTVVISAAVGSVASAVTSFCAQWTERRARRRESLMVGTASQRQFMLKQSVPVRDDIFYDEEYFRDLVHVFEKGQLARSARVRPPDAELVHPDRTSSVQRNDDMVDRSHEPPCRVGIGGEAVQPPHFDPEEPLAPSGLRPVGALAHPEVRSNQVDGRGLVQPIGAYRRPSRHGS